MQMIGSTPHCFGSPYRPAVHRFSQRGPALFPFADRLSHPHHLANWRCSHVRMWNLWTCPLDFRGQVGYVFTGGQLSTSLVSPGSPRRQKKGATLPVGSRTASAAQQTLGSGSLRQPSSTGQRARAAQNKWTRVRRFRGAALLHRLCTANLRLCWALHREVGRGEQLWPAAAVTVSLLVERPARGLWEFCGSPQPPGADSGS
jgi:hypothetical protein